MTEYKNQLENDGMLLKTIPAKERTEEMCLIAVMQNSKALKYVPEKIRTVEFYKSLIDYDPSLFLKVPTYPSLQSLCRYAIKKDASLIGKVIKRWRYNEDIGRAILKYGSVRDLQLIPHYEIDSICPTASQALVKKCLAWMVEVPTAWQYLPSCVRADSSVLEHLKAQGYLRYRNRYYDKATNQFVINVYIQLRDNEDEEEYVSARFPDFETFYHFLDGDIKYADLRGYSFSGTDLHDYDINGAIIDSNVLILQGLYDDTYYRNIVSCAADTETVTANNELSLRENYNYIKPVENTEVVFTDMMHQQKIPVFYVSDIHLGHRIKNRFGDHATQQEVYAFIRDLAIGMLETVTPIPAFSILLIAGDTSSTFEFGNVFYRTIAERWHGKIVVVHGNHELVDPALELDDNIAFYRKFFKSIGICFLQNELLCFDDYIHDTYSFSEQEILDMSESELHAKLLACPFMILGGLGFSGFNDKYNASNLVYGPSFDALSREEAKEKDIEEAKRFEALYLKIANALPHNNVLVLTHTGKYCWCPSDNYIPNWIYVHGHDHRNFYEDNSYRRIFADNQIGYHIHNVGLKYFYADNDYDIFADTDDGIHFISGKQYYEFYRGKRISMSFKNHQREIIMLKRCSYYMFLYYGKYNSEAKKAKLYLLDGGKMNVLSENPSAETILYYYDKMDKYVSNICFFLHSFSKLQKEVSQFIKNIGGWGHIHGCIVDVEFPNLGSSFSYNHVFVNPYDGSITPYFAWDKSSRVIYRDFKTLLEHKCPNLLSNYEELEQAGAFSLTAIKYGTSIEEWGEEESVYDEGGYLYKPSGVIGKMQYCTEKNIIRLWHEGFLDTDSTKKKMMSENSIPLTSPPL